jgi:hypothetical protein
VLLEPFTVRDKRVERQPLVWIDAVRRRIGVERPGATRIGKMRGAPWRAHQHAVRHVVAPECHRLAKHMRRNAGVAKMGCDRKTVRTCADDDGLAGAGLTRHHVPIVYRRICVVNVLLRWLEKQRTIPIADLTSAFRIRSN